MSVRKVLLSPNHSIFAYNTEREGMEYGELHFKDLDNRADWEVFAHVIGTDQSQDVLVYEELDDTVFVDITSSKDGNYVTINANSLSSSEVRVIESSHDYINKAVPNVKLVKPRVPGVEYYVDHHDDRFYILTNADNAKNFKLVSTPDHAIGKSNWTDLITMSSTEKIEDVDLFQNNVVIYGRRDGLPMILCHDLRTKETHQVPLPEKFCVLNPGTNLDFNTDVFRFSVISPFTHESTYEYDMSTRKLHSIRVQTIRKNPVLMRSYGAYGTSTDIEFRVEQFPLIERGWVIALAHVSFKDFISVAEHLVETKLTSSEYLTAMGTSAGGLLVGAMLHMRPDLFRALVLKVPFVDPLSSMLNPELPLTQIEYPEWGNPTQDAKAYDLIESYSPYENINADLFKSRSSLPSLFVTGGMKDQRVAYWQPLKFVACLRHFTPQTFSSTVLLKMDLDRGHFGGGGSEQDSRLSDVAEQMAFLITQVQK
ncbi:prolyl oligopeptidase family-domain-containing protein [Parasitella parasitica]|nr:prolyl oligopeptidase family-domain-containing protein [Parasitella parasitica]